MKTLEGIKFNKGEYQGKPYQNYTLFYKVEPHDNIYGHVQASEKIKYDLFNEFLQKNKLDVNSAIGINYESYYNQYGQMNLIEKK